MRPQFTTQEQADLLTYLMDVALAYGEYTNLINGRHPNALTLSSHILREIEKAAPGQVRNGVARDTAEKALRRMIDSVRRDKTTKFLRGKKCPILDEELSEDTFAGSRWYHGGRIMRSLREGNILTRRALIPLSRWQLRELRYMGVRTVNEIEDWLAEQDLYLGMAVNDHLESWLERHTSN